VHESTENAERSISRGRKWLFIFILTIVIPAGLIVLSELGLRLSGFGYPSGFYLQREIQSKNVYTDNIDFSRRFFRPELARPANHFALPAEKPSESFRIFVLGGSAAMGDPGPAFAFSRMLEEMLRYKFPGKNIEVVNAAITAINSHVVLPIARDCAEMQPDLFIVYLGNNEVIGPYGPGTVFAPFSSSLGLIRANVYLKSTKLGQLVNGISRQIQTDQEEFRGWGGVDMFVENRIRHDDPRIENVYGHFRENLADICEVGRKAGAEVLLSTVPTNIRDCAPFGSLHRTGLDDSTVNRWESLYKAGITAESVDNFKSAASHYLEAAEIDSEYADLQYRLGQSYLALNQYEAARRHFRNARNLDALRFRADTRINRIIREVAEEGNPDGVSLLNACSTFQNTDDRDLPGDSLFYDHVHLNLRGNYLLANLLEEQVETMINGESSRGTLSLRQVADRLAFTLWDRYRITRDMLRRKRSPAFKNRIDNAAMIRHLDTDLDSLENRLQSKASLSAVRNAYREAINLDRQDWMLRNNYGLFLLEAFGDPAGAAEQFRFILEKFPYDYRSHNNLGLAYAQQDNLHDAAGRFGEALRIKPSFPQAHYNLGNTLARLEDYPQAIAHFRQAHLSAREMAGIYIRYGEYLVKEGKSGEALMRFREALGHWSESPEAHLQIADTYIEIGKPDSAIRYLAELVEFRPEHVEGRIDLASLLFKQGDYPGAIRHYEQALRIEPDLSDVQNNLGLALSQVGRFGEAIPHFQKAIELKEDYLGARSNLAGALSQLGRREEAINQLREALRINPDNPGLHNNLGAELLSAGKTDLAISHFRKALKLDPDSYSARNNLNYALSQAEEQEK